MVHVQVPDMLSLLETCLVIVGSNFVSSCSRKFLHVSPSSTSCTTIESKLSFLWNALELGPDRIGHCRHIRFTRVYQGCQSSIYFHIIHHGCTLLWVAVSFPFRPVSWFRDVIWCCANLLVVCRCKYDQKAVQSCPCISPQEDLCTP